MSNEKNKEGFIKIPHDLFNALLVCNFSKRETKLLLLILRITLGCHRTWGITRQADLNTIGVKDQHAKANIESLLKKGALVKNDKTNELRIDIEYVLKGASRRKSQLNRLSKLVGKNLPRKHTSQNGDPNPPNSESMRLPHEEVVTSAFGKLHTYPKREDLDSYNTSFEAMKDILKEKIKYKR